MTFKQFKAYIGVLLLGTTLGATLMPKDAKADIAEATATIEAMGIKSNPENIANTDLVINLKDTLKEYTTTGAIPTKYDELVIYGERRTPENGSNLDTFLKVKTAWSKNVAFNNADEDEDIYPKLSNGCIRLSLSSTAITKLKEEGLRLDGQAFYIHSVVIEPKQ